MTRRGVFATLVGAVGLKAQIPQSSENVTGLAWGERKPRNGQCPVCGRQAAAWKQPTVTVRDGMKPGPGDGTVYLLSHEEPWGPDERRVDCEWCNCTFRQRAEGGTK